MTLDERLQTIEEFVKRSDDEFDNGGNAMVAAEILWGALAHCLIALAEINEWRCEGHQGYREVARRLDSADQPGRWRSDFAAGEQLHTYFYQRNLQLGELQSRRSASRFAVRQLVPTIRRQIGPQNP